MAGSIEQRIFRLVLIVNLLFLASVLTFAWWSLEDLEDTMLFADRDAELHYFAENVEKDKVHRVVTAQIINAYIPHGTPVDSNLPIIFSNVPVPFSGEVEFMGTEYFVVTQAFPEGNYYLARDLQLFEDREKKLSHYVLLLSVMSVAVCVLMAWVFSKRIAYPVRRFAERLASIDSKAIARVSEEQEDVELQEIAKSLNALLYEIELVTERERMLLRMASHELRTPVAVVLGAARIIEARGQLQADDSKTLQRIITAAEDMAANIRALLALVRQTPQELRKDNFALGPVLGALCRDYALENPEATNRLRWVPAEHTAHVNADKALVRMLFHNLISNALNHTAGKVGVYEFADKVQVCDAGTLPMAPKVASATQYKSSAGLGLYIVNLICEHLGWELNATQQESGQCIEIRFPPTVNPVL